MPNPNKYIMNIIPVLKAQATSQNWKQADSKSQKNMKSILKLCLLKMM